MEPTEERKFEANWSKPKRLLKTLVQSLAFFEGGNTPDVVRQGAEELWPGVLIVAEVLNCDPIYLDQEAYPDRISYGDYPVYALTIYNDKGEEVESVQIDGISGDVVSSDDTGTPYFGPGQETPDFMIESFIVRYHLNDKGQAEEALPSF
jgi:hypothetical protein